VQFKDPEHAVQAFFENDGTIFQGRLLHIISAESKRESKLDEFSLSKLPLKKQKEIKRKADAAGSSFNWNSLYMNVGVLLPPCRYSLTIIGRRSHIHCCRTSRRQQSGCA
jgi:multiple RNA-binding domain-containing protein 1